MTNLNRFFSEEDEQIISDYTQFDNKPQQRHDNGNGRYDDRRRQRYNDRGDRGGGYARQNRDDDRERQQREYELKKAAETKAELKALKEAMKANEDPYKDAMRREEYYRARRKRDMSKLALLGLAGAIGYGFGHWNGESDKEKEMKQAQEQKKSEGTWLIPYTKLRQLFSDPENGRLVTRYFNAYPQQTGYAPSQTYSPQQPLQSASISSAPPQQGAQPQQNRQPQATGDEAKQIQRLDSDIAALRQDNMQKQQQLQQLSQQNFGAAMRNISGYTTQMAPLTNAFGNVVRAAGSGALNVVGDAAKGAWNGIRSMFSTESADCIAKYFSGQQTSAKDVIKQKTEVRDKLKKQNEELSEAVDEKENSAGTMFYQLSAANPALAAQLAGSAGNVVNGGIMAGVNLLNKGYKSLTKGNQLINTDIIQSMDNNGITQSLTSKNAEEKAAQEAAAQAAMLATASPTNATVAHK